LGLLLTLGVAWLWLVVGCTYYGLATPSATPEVSAPDLTPTDVWSGLLQTTPYPYRTPLPPPTPAALDGTYAKFETKEGTPVPCKRCPDYAPEGGVWKLNLDRGIFRVLHQVTGWRSLGSYTVSADRLVLFNDPNCPDVVGTYRWRVEAGELLLDEIEDECSIGLRAMNLTHLPWRSCRPPNVEAAVTAHWPRPPGCD